MGMDPLGRIRNTAQGIVRTLNAAKETIRDAIMIVKTATGTQDITREINRIGRRWHPLPDEEKAELMGAALDVMNQNPEAKQILLRVIREYGTAYKTQKMADEHRRIILQHLESNTPPKAQDDSKKDPVVLHLEQINDVLKAINSAEKKHVDIIVGALNEHGLEKIHPIVRAYTKSDPETKKIIAEALKRAKTAEHIQRIQDHAQKLGEIHPEVKSQLIKLIEKTNNFEEIDSLIMAAHNATGAIKDGKPKEDILNAFASKEQAIKRFGKPREGWERM